MEAFLEEILLLCQRSEEYTLYLLARMADVVAPEALPPSRETALRGGSFSSGRCHAAGCSMQWVGVNEVTLTLHFGAGDWSACVGDGDLCAGTSAFQCTCAMSMSRAQSCARTRACEM